MSTWTEPKTLPCPMPVWMETTNPDDPDGDYITVLRQCGNDLTYEVTDGGEFYDDLTPCEVGPMWRLGCGAGHVLGMNYSEDDVPGPDTAYSPAVGQAILDAITVALPEVAS